MNSKPSTSVSSSQAGPREVGGGAPGCLSEDQPASPLQRSAAGQQHQGIQVENRRQLEVPPVRRGPLPDDQRAGVRRERHRDGRDADPHTGARQRRGRFRLRVATSGRHRLGSRLHDIIAVRSGDAVLVGAVGHHRLARPRSCRTAAASWSTTPAMSPARDCREPWPRGAGCGSDCRKRSAARHR